MNIAEKHYKVLIIGSAPAGLTAAIYASRANRRPMVIEGVQPGGQLTITTDVENYPGFPQGIMGPQLMDEFRNQAERFGTNFITDMVSEVDLTRRPFTVKIGKDKMTADTIIVSTGASAKMLGLESEKVLMGHGLSACATCDGFFFNGQEVIVIGGGDTACEEATFLTRFASKVTMVHRRDELRASKVMQERVFANPKIEMKWNRVVLDFVASPEGSLESAILQDTQTGEKETFVCKGAFLGIGHTPNTQLFKDTLKMDELGYIITKPDSTATDIVGVFVCGDAQDHVYRQAITASGTGCMAAIEAERLLGDEEAEAT